MLHAAFVRSPHPHALIKQIDVAAALSAPGVEAVFTAKDVNPMCKPFIGVAQHRPGHRSPPQKLFAEERALWQGQPIAVVVASTRAEGEDAAALIEIAWEPLEPVWQPREAIDKTKPVVHPELGDNIAFDFTIDKGDLTKAFAQAAVIVGDDFRFERQQAMTLEPRGLIADYNSADGTLTVIHAHQSPFQMQDIYSDHFDIPEHKVKVVTPDIGGGFGMKLNVYADELGTVAASIKLGRPVKYHADRLELFFVGCACARPRDLGADGGLRGWTHHRDGRRRYRRGRRLRHAAALQYRRRHDDDHSLRRSVRVLRLQGAHAQRLREQEFNRHVPRRRHALRLPAAGGACRSRGEQARRRSGRISPPQFPQAGELPVRDARWTKDRPPLIRCLFGQAR